MDTGMASLAAALPGTAAPAAGARRGRGGRGGRGRSRGTMLCRNWVEVGSCPHGDACHFSHAAPTPQEPSSPPPKPVTLCRNWAAAGSCIHGDACRFAHESAAALVGDAQWGVKRVWAAADRDAKPCKFGAGCAREGCWFAHPEGTATRDTSARFSVVTWNIQSASTRGREFDKSDRSAVEACVRQLLTDPALRVPDRRDHPADIISLQELMRCKRQMMSGDCIHCARGSCRDDHAGWVQRQLQAAGYDGAIHESSMRNTVGLFWRREAFELPPRRPGSDEGTVFFCDFNRPYAVGGPRSGAKESHKGAVLAVLQQVAAHPSVPMHEGQPSPLGPLAEVKQLLKKVNSIYSRNGHKGNFPWLVAADLNSVSTPTPGCAEPLVYDFFTRLGLRSAYSTALGREPATTSIKPDFRHTIDYVLAAATGLTVHGVLDVVDLGAPRQQPPPWPSDHLPLLAEFSLLPYDT